MLQVGVTVFDPLAVLGFAFPLPLGSVGLDHSSARQPPLLPLRWLPKGASLVVGEKGLEEYFINKMYF